MSPQTNPRRPGTWFGVIASLLFVFALPVNHVFSGPNRIPNEPLTGKYSVQWFIGNTNQCMVSIYSPLNYQDGTRIAAGADVKMKFYRSYDGGKTYGEKGVESKKQTYINFKDPTTGQPRFDPARIAWINCALEIPVDAPKPMAIELLGERPDGTKADGKESTVYLAVAAVVDGAESKKTTKFLTFSYAAGGKPMLLRYETPDKTDDVTPTNLVNVPAQVLADRGGLWEGSWTWTTYSIADEYLQLDAKHPQRNLVKNTEAQMGKVLGKAMPMKIKVTSMEADRGQGDNGKVAFFGTADLDFINMKHPMKSKAMKSNVVYYRNPNLVIFEFSIEGQRGEFTGHVFENGTEYELYGAMRFTAKKMATIQGLWTVKQKK